MAPWNALRAACCASLVILVARRDRHRRRASPRSFPASRRSPASSQYSGKVAPLLKKLDEPTHRLRRQRRLPRHARPARPPAGQAERGAEDADPRGHRHRGPHLLRQPGRRRAVDGPGVPLQRRLGRGRAGRLDDHPAADQEPVLQEPEARPRPQDQGGGARGPAQRRVVEEPHPRGVPQHRLLRAGLLRREGRGRAVLQRRRSTSSTSRSPRCSPGSSRTRRARTRSRTRTRRSIAARERAARRW